MSGSSNHNSTKTPTGAGAAGAGGGTLLVLIGNSLSPESEFKTWFMLAVPTLSVLLSVLWISVNLKVGNFLRDRQFNALRAEARRTLKDALANEHTTQAHRKKLQKELEKLELIVVGRQMERIQAIEIFTEDDIPSADA